jgi:GT2 family glycosyltransferase
LRSVVLRSSAATGRARIALERALERLPARVVDVEPRQRGERLRELARDPEIDWFVVVDDDAVVLPTAFASLARAQSTHPAIIGGQATIDGAPHFGASFAAPRSGPDPFELAPIAGFQADRLLLAAVRGPVDVPQRGVLVIDAAFLRGLGDVALDSAALHLDLAVLARNAGRTVVCEPSMAFTRSPDNADVVRALGRLRRYAGLACWNVDELHREPASLRNQFVHRETRIAGDIRGFQRQHRPPVDILLDSSAIANVEWAKRAAAALELGGEVVVFPGDGTSLRDALARTGERYVLLVDAEPIPTAADVIALIERLERSGRNGLAVMATEAPFRAAMFHAHRITGAHAYVGASARDVLRYAIDHLPQQRLFAVGPGGTVIAETMPPLAAPRTIDFVYVSSSKPEIAAQTVRPLVQEPLGGALTAIVAGGSDTVVRVLSVFADVRFEYDGVDPLLSRGLNRVLAASTADAVLIVRDDVQLPRGAVGALLGAFSRIPRLGAAVPRVRNDERPEAQDRIGYDNISQMQDLQDRRAVMYAREARLVEGSVVPVMLVSREALQTVGGFHERYGFTQFGIADFTRRLRLANYLIAQCDDAYAHVFPREIVQSPHADLDAAVYLRDAFEASWAGVTAFDPAVHRVTVSADGVATAVADVLHVLVFIDGNEQWSRFRPQFETLAHGLRASDPAEIVIGVGPGLSLPAALAEVRETLIRTGRPLDETVNVIFQTRHEPDVWEGIPPRAVRLTGFDHPALAALTTVDDLAAIKAMLETISA